MKPIQLAAIFSDHMVLQRDKKINVWGESSDHHRITVRLQDTEVTVEPENGKWYAVLPPMPAASSCEMVVTSGNPEADPIVIHDVAIGEVWIAGGQSNMKFPLKFDAEANESISSSNHPSIRFFDCPEISYDGQENEEDFSAFGFWRPCDPAHAPFYSAVGYYFAQDIYQSMNVPIGIVGCTIVGTMASTWLHEDYLVADNQLNRYLTEYELAVKNLDLEEYNNKFEQANRVLSSPRYKQMTEGLMSGIYTNEQINEELSRIDISVFQPLIGPKYVNRPAGIYHTMVEPIVGYTARGVLWYQGESDDNEKAPLYHKLFSALIQCWRDAWQDDLPFLFVQLAPFREWLTTPCIDFTILREQQELVSKTVPNAYMASIMDVGMEFDIHPKQKRPVGERLARLARSKVYGENLICEAPEVANALLEEDRITITFDHVGDGFMLEGEQINGLQIYVNGEEINGFTAGVEEDTMTITSPDWVGTDTVEIRFAWTNYVKVNLYSSVGLPVKPFRRVISS